MKQIIELYKKQRRYKHLTRQYRQQYAFIGIGNHALSNLYPVLDYLGISLKYVVAISRKTLHLLNRLSSKYKAVNDPKIVFADDMIKGVFICTTPDSHYELCKSALKHNLHVFVEKPPCRTTEELEELIRYTKEAGKEVVVGLQRRYAPACKILKKKLNRTIHYTYKYCAGPCPEYQQVLTDLFIHPIDLIIFLFGKAKLISLLHSGQTILLQIQHENGIIGSVELSTDYSWQMATEQMTIVEKNDMYELNNLSELLHRKKPLQFANIPLEKVFRNVPVTEILFNQNIFQPVLQQNNLYINGFYSELETFISICENEGNKKNNSGLELLRDTYLLLDEIRMKISTNN